MSTTTSNIVDLPAELILQILTYLQPSSRISLSLVCKHMRQWTTLVSHRSLVSPSAGHCEVLAVKRYNEENRLLQTDKRRCVLCSAVQSVHFYRDKITPICNWHDGWFMALQTPLLNQHLRKPLMRIASRGDLCWVAVNRRYCVHQREILGWHVEDCHCECGSCGHFDVVCYVRASPGNSRPNSWRLRDVDDGNGTVVIESRIWDSRLPKQYIESRLSSDMLRTHDVEVPVVHLEHCWERTEIGGVKH